jgi:hypothetical protein
MTRYWCISCREAPSGGPYQLCRMCTDAMRDGGYPSLEDFMFAQHPACPRCGAQRARALQYRMPVSPHVPPWVALAGCVVSDERWNCENCSHSW